MVSLLAWSDLDLIFQQSLLTVSTVGLYFFLQKLLITVSLIVNFAMCKPSGFSTLLLLLFDLYFKYDE